MAFTEFYAINGGSNLNAGSDHTGLEPITTALYTATNGGWNGTTTYTPTDGSTPASTVTVGDFASVYLDGATVAVYIARVVTVNAGVNGTIVLSSSIKAGAAPASLGTGRSIKVGGAWVGPSGTSLFPLTLANLSTLAVSNTTKTRINLKNNQTYSMTTNTTVGVGAGNITVQGYTNTAGDGGRSVIDYGATTGICWDTTASGIFYIDLIFSTSAGSGTSALIRANSGLGVVFYRCVAHGSQGSGFELQAGFAMAIECEAYDCNKSNNGNTGGFTTSGAGGAPVIFLRCYSHNHTGGTHADGFFSVTTQTVFQNCIADTCSGCGFHLNATGGAVINVECCDAYNNTLDGILCEGPDFMVIENCNLIKNGGWGINFSGLSGVTFNALITNCGFGSGTQANGSGTSTSAGSLVETGDVIYAANVTPWFAPTTGDFRISLPAAVSTGKGAFTQTGNSKTGAAGFPDIGAAQSLHFIAVSSTSTAYVS